MQSLATAHLVLEPLTVAHAEEMFDVLSDEAIYRHLDEAAPASVEHLRRVYAKREARRSPDGSEGWLNWVVRAHGRQLVGLVQGTVFAPDSAWIAYVFSSKHWGRGYAHEATESMLAHLAKAYGVRRNLATVEVENERSIRLLDRLGFVRVAPHETAGHDLSATELLFLR